MDDNVLRRWMGLEAHRINAGVVRQPVPLERLLASERPAVEGRDGSSYPLDAEALRRLADEVPPWLHRRLRVPLVFYEPHDIAGQAYIEDAAAIEALQAIGEGLSPRDGRMWVGVVALRRLRQRFPTLVQTFLL